MPYEVKIETTEGTIRREINELEELRELLLKYYDTYTGMEVKNKELIKKMEKYD